MLSEQRQLFSPHTRLFLTVGILGAFTTFSTFGYETLELLRDRNLQAVAVNILANVMCGLLAVWAGVALVRLVWK
jgi:CrcB protein